MIFSEYVANLQQLLLDNPQLVTANVAYASDDEGNKYSCSVFAPSIRYKHISDDDHNFETAIDRESDTQYFADYADELQPIVLIN